MAIDFKGWGWVTPPNNYEGLYNISDNIRKENRNKAAVAEKEKAQGASMSKFLTDYLDPKDQLSGSPYDPVITKGFSDILQEGISIMNANKGITTDMLLMSLSPKVGKLSEYAQKAKVIKQNIDKGLAEIGEKSGYDKVKLGQLAREGAFYDENGQLKPLETVDPSVNYIKETVAKRPYDVTTSKSIDDYMKNLDKNVHTTELVTVSPLGGRKRTKVKVTAPAGFVPELDESGVATKRFVPEYENAFDNREPIIHEFDDGKGGKKKAQVRVVDKATFNRVMATRPDAADWLRGQVMKYSKDYLDADGNPIGINSPQAEMVARAILYDELKSRNVGSMEEIVETKAPQIRITNSSGSGGSGSASAITNDIYGKVDSLVTDAEKKGFQYGRINALDVDAQKAVIDFANTVSGDIAGAGKAYDQSNIFVAKEPDGRVAIYKENPNHLKNAETIIGYLPRVGTNLKVQANTKGKQKVIEMGEPEKRKTFNVVDPNNGEIKMYGVDEATANKAKAKGYKIQ